MALFTKIAQTLEGVFPLYKACRMVWEAWTSKPGEAAPQTGEVLIKTWRATLRRSRGRHKDFPLRLTDPCRARIDVARRPLPCSRVLRARQRFAAPTERRPPGDRLTGLLRKSQNRL